MGWNSLGGVAGRHHRHSVRHTAFSVDAERNRGVPLLLLPLSLVSEGSSSPSDHRVNTRGRREKGVALARAIHILAYLLTGPFHKSSYCYRMYSVRWTVLRVGLDRFVGKNIPTNRSLSSARTISMFESS